MSNPIEQWLPIAFRCRACHTQARQNPTDPREWGCPSCGGSSHSVFLNFEALPTVTKSDPCKRCGNIWIVEVADPEVCPSCCLHVNEERRKCPRCQWQGWGFPGADCPSCGLAGEEPVDLGDLLS